MWDLLAPSCGINVSLSSFSLPYQFCTGLRLCRTLDQFVLYHDVPSTNRSKAFQLLLPVLLVISCPFLPPKFEDWVILSCSKSMSTSNPHFNCMNYDPQAPSSKMELNFSLAAENGWLSCNRVLNFYFYFLSSTTYEEGNEAKLKRELFSIQLMKSLPVHLSNGIAW